MDLAWGQRGVTGLAVIDEAGTLLDITTRRTDDEIIDWLRYWTDGPCFVAFDAPVIVVNPTGHRPCERLISRYFGRYGASCHAANTSNPSFVDGSRALRLATALELSTDPIAPAPRRAAEVYPHPALVALFDLPKILQYKAKPGRDFIHLQAEMLRLTDLLESLADASPPLLLKASPEWRRIRQALAGARLKADLKRLEDAIDAVVCAYIAAYANTPPRPSPPLRRPRIRHHPHPHHPRNRHPLRPEPSRASPPAAVVTSSGNVLCGRRAPGSPGAEDCEWVSGEGVLRLARGGVWGLLGGGAELVGG